jgi:hypothetical protein
MTPGTRIRLRHAIGLWPRGTTGVVVEPVPGSLHGFEFAAMLTRSDRLDGHPATNLNTAEVDVIEAAS